MKNYFNTLNFREQLISLRTRRFINLYEFNNIEILKNKKIVIVGCGAQGLNQGLNLRDSGCDVSFVLQKTSIKKKTQSWKNAVLNNFNIGTYKTLIPSADLVINLTPDKCHSIVVKKLQKLMKRNSFLGYSHGFNIVEMGEKIRSDISVIMVAPKCPGTEVREEFLKGFGVPALIAVHTDKNLYSLGLEVAKAWAFSLGSHKAGVLESSFSAEVKSDLMGEQTILCGMLQACSLACYEHLINKGYDKEFSVTFLQFGWEKLTESMKCGGLTLMLNRLSNSAKIRACELSDKLKKILEPLFISHMDAILSGKFSKEMMKDWQNDDAQLKKWRKNIQESDFEKSSLYKNLNFKDQDYFDKGMLMVVMLKAGVELAYETMLAAGISKESAYYESLHELPLIANTIARTRLHEMNLVISDTAEYGSHLFTQNALPLLRKFLESVQSYDLGESIPEKNIDNLFLNNLDEKIQNHSIEIIGKKLRYYMQHNKDNFCLKI